jgi:hypothetical protein
MGKSATKCYLVYAWKNYPSSTKLSVTLCGAPFPSIDEKLFCFCNSVLYTAVVTTLSLTISHSPQNLLVFFNGSLYIFKIKIC